MSYEIRLEAFEGPFDLLLHLIEKNQVDIYDIPISEITAQYLEYLDAMEQFDIEIASSFLVMAAKLLSIKSRMLVPSRRAEDETEETVDEREELVHDLLEYMRYKQAAAALDELCREENKYINRPNDEQLYAALFSDTNPLDGKTLTDLTAAFREVLLRMEKQPQVFDIVREEITVGEKMRDIYRLLRENSRGVAFTGIFVGSRSRVAVVVTFLALLELARQSVLKIRQSDSYGEIFLYPYHLDNYRVG